MGAAVSRTIDLVRTFVLFDYCASISICSLPLQYALSGDDACESQRGQFVMWCTNHLHRAERRLHSACGRT